MTMGKALTPTSPPSCPHLFDPDRRNGRCTTNAGALTPNGLSSCTVRCAEHHTAPTGANTHTEENP